MPVLDARLAVTNEAVVSDVLAEGLWAPRIGAAPLSLFGLLATGILTALALTRYSAGLLFHVSPNDTATFATATALLTGSAALFPSGAPPGRSPRRRFATTNIPLSSRLAPSDNSEFVARGPEAAAPEQESMSIRINVDGQLGTEEDCLLSPLDQGFLFGASVYETIRTYDGVPFVLERHLERLRASAEALGIDIDVSTETLTERLYGTLAEAGNAEASIRIVISAGVGAIDYRTGSARKPTVVIIVRPLPDYPESLYRDGAKAAFATVMRASRGNLSPKIKSSNLLNNIMALRQAHEKGAYEALLLNARGEVCEGSMSNVFVVQGGTVATPPLSSGLLEGITREHVIEIARGKGIELEQKTFTPEDLLGADEVFITASARQVVPIVRVDETTIGDGKPGPVTRQIMKFYQDHVRALMSTTETVD